jgi:hypothetical protein
MQFRKQASQQSNKLNMGWDQAMSDEHFASGIMIMDNGEVCNGRVWYKNKKQ